MQEPKLYSSYSDVLHCSGGSCNVTEFPCYISCQDGSLGNIAQVTGWVFFFVHGRKYPECSGEQLISFCSSLGFAVLNQVVPSGQPGSAAGRPFSTWGTSASNAGFHPNSHWRGNRKNCPKGKCHCVLLGKGLQNQFASLFLKWCWAELEVRECQTASLRQLCLISL